MPTLQEFFKNLPELKLDESKKRILLIYVLVLAVVLLIYFNFFLKPGLTTLFRLIPKVRLRSTEIKTIQTDLLLEDKLNAKLESLNAKLGQYGKMLSREKELPLLLESLAKLAKDSGVKILGITPVVKQGKDQKDIGGEKSVYQEVPIVITARSGYHELGTFINSLENDERYMQISEIKIKTSKEDPKKHDIEFVVYAYTFKTSE